MINKITLNNLDLNLEIKIKDIKNINIKIKDENTIFISCNSRIKLKDIEILLEKNKAWVIKNIQALKNSKVETDKLLYLGNSHKYIIKKCEEDKVLLNKETLIIKCKIENKEYINSLIKEWYFKEALIILTEEINKISEEINLYPTKVSIGNQKTLWGSCNSKKEIRLNWRLILMPYEIRRYIMIHEPSR